MWLADDSRLGRSIEAVLARLLVAIVEAQRREAPAPSRAVREEAQPPSVAMPPNMPMKTSSGWQACARETCELGPHEVIDAADHDDAGDHDDRAGDGAPLREEHCGHRSPHQHRCPIGTSAAMAVSSVRSAAALQADGEVGRCRRCHLDERVMPIDSEHAAAEPR